MGMGKIKNKIKSHWKIIFIGLVSLAIIIGFLLYIIHAWDTHGPEVTMTRISLFIAVIVAIVALSSLKMTRDSLELSRATQRPFMNVTGISVILSKNDGSPTSVKYLVVHISNQGIFPADQISVVLNVSKINSNNQNHLFVVQGEIPSICFPGKDISNLIFKETEEKEKLTVAAQGKLKVKIEINYKNKLTQKSHRTTQSYSTQYLLSITREPTPLSEEDYWD